jgi:hypothetical protein
MPPEHQVTKNHKRLSIIVIALVEFSVLELWWQIFYFSELTQDLKYKKLVINIYYKIKYLSITTTAA